MKIDVDVDALFSTFSAQSARWQDEWMRGLRPWAPSVASWHQLVCMQDRVQQLVNDRDIWTPAHKNDVY